MATTSCAVAPLTSPVSFQQAEMLRRIDDFPQCARRYDGAVLYDLRGPLDVDALGAALEDLIFRHEILRSTVARTCNGGVQRVHDEPLVPVACRRRPGATLTELGAELAAARIGAGATLTGHALFRPQLVELFEDRTVLAIAIHHLLYDGLSFRVLWRDLSELYAARVERRAARLPSSPLTYAEYARRQREAWPELARRAVPFWRDVTVGAPREIAWPASPATDCDRFAIRTHTWSCGGGVAATARVTRSSPFLVLLAATGAAVSRVTGQDDILLGTDFANREHASRSDIVGHVLNTRLTRTRRQRGQSLIDLVRDVREAWLDADDHRDAYLDEVLRELDIPPLPSVHMQPIDLLDGPRFDGIDVRPAWVEQWPMYWRPFMVMWRADRDRYEGEVTYRPACLSDGTVEAVASEIDSILEHPSELL